MTEAGVKTGVGLFVVLSYFGLLVMTIALYAAGGFLFEEMTTTVALLVPMFGIYTSAVIKHILGSPRKLQAKGEAVTNSYAFISFFVPILFALLVGIAIWMKAFNIAFSSFDQFKITLGILQTGFGAYMGLVLSALFKIKKTGRP